MSADFTHAILDWARSKPADEAYHYTSPSNCAICQFLRETGRATEPRVVPSWWRDGAPGAPLHKYDGRVNDAACGTLDNPKETFGAFADRLAALVSA